MKKSFSLILILNLLLMPCYAEHEKEVVVRNVRGEFSMVTDMNITAKKAQEFAREDAMKKALFKVCNQQMSLWDQIESSSAGESFNSLTSVQVDGEIVKFEIKNEGSMQNPAREKEWVFFCEADITVKKGGAPDPDFTATVKGLKKSYIADEEISFSITPYQNAYLKVFIFEDAELGYRIYPNDLEKPFLMQANTTYNFPTGRATYPVYTDKEIETDRMVFILTKTERPFYEETTSRREIEMWMAKIPKDQKFVYYTSINILKR